MCSGWLETLDVKLITVVSIMYASYCVRWIKNDTNGSHSHKEPVATETDLPTTDKHTVRVRLSRSQCMLTADGSLVYYGGTCTCTDRNGGRTNVGIYHMGIRHIILYGKRAPSCLPFRAPPSVVLLCCRGILYYRHVPGHLLFIF